MSEVNIQALRDKFKSKDQNLAKDKSAKPKVKFKSKYIKLAKSDRPLPRLRLIFNTGKQIMLPYGIQPYIIYQPEGIIMLTTHQYKVKIIGRGLDQLLEYLYADQVIWIKEATMRIDCEDDPVFIKSIQVKGSVLNEQF